MGAFLFCSALLLIVVVVVVVVVAAVAAIIYLFQPINLKVQLLQFLCLVCICISEDCDIH